MTLRGITEPFPFARLALTAIFLFLPPRTTRERFFFLLVAIYYLNAVHLRILFAGGPWAFYEQARQQRNSGDNMVF